jgi:hypothetical protein
MAVEISTRIANLLRDIARAEGRSEEEVLDDALALYQRWVPEHHSAEQFAEFQAFLNQMSSRFDLDEDEAMRIAIEEQKAFRRERSESERNGR